MKALLSIKPEFVDEILAGRKKYEYRKRIFKKQVDSVIIYASMPVGRIIGEFIIGEIISSKPEDVWKKTKKYSGISHDFYSAYFYGKEEAYAIEIKQFIPYDDPINPYEFFDDFIAPQSYRYVE